MNNWLLDDEILVIICESHTLEKGFLWLDILDDWLNNDLAAADLVTFFLKDLNHFLVSLLSEFPVNPDLLSKLNLSIRVAESEESSSLAIQST